MHEAGAQITQLMRAIGEDAGGRSEQLLPLVYEELRQLAHRRMRDEPAQTLQPTALVHEAFLRLVSGEPSWDSRGHFFAAAAEAMRRILIERARRRARLRHGGGQTRLDLDMGEIAVDQQSDEMLALDQALTRLEALDARMAKVVKLRYFAGLDVDQIALALDLGARTVDRDWVAAKAWLYRELSAPDAGS
jgi:RNA polymerase sigma factor (TIGR02999 family)